MFNPDQPTVWIGIHDTRQCPDCASLAGKTMTWGEWMNGDVLPGNGHTVCGDWCRCILAPADWAEEFGNPPMMDVSVPTITAEILTGAAVQENTLTRWAVMQETEPGFNLDPQQDIIETARMYLSGSVIEQETLRVDFPKHYLLIGKLLK